MIPCQLRTLELTNFAVHGYYSITIPGWSKVEGQAFATRQEPLLLEGVIVVALEISFALQGRGNRWGPRWQAEALQDRPDRIGQMHCSENPQAPATTVAFENIQRENPRHQLGPWVISRPAAVLILRLA